MKAWQFSLRACLIAALAANSTARAQLDDDLDPGDLAYPVVITPTRLKQPLADAPASVTVITAETIRRYGLSDIGDILRLVPGMAVTQATGNDLRVNYHGTYAISPRRLNVLVDGVSIYRPGFSRVEWALLPVALEDIDHIEVIRGPNSAAYGPNSMAAVINILTRHPKDVERGMVAVSMDSRNAVDTTMRLGTTLGTTSVRATANVQRDSGYDHLSLGYDSDSTLVKRLNVRAVNELGGGATLDMQASYLDARLGTHYTDPYQASPPDQNRHDAQWSARWTKPLSADHELQIEAFQAHASTQQTWLTCWPQAALLPQVSALYQANPAYVYQIYAGQMPSGGSAQDDILAARALLAIQSLGLSAFGPTCGQANQNGHEARTQIELQDTYVQSNALRLVGGLGLRRQTAESASYFGGTVGSTVKWLFGHVEYRPVEWLIGNLGGYAESNSLSGNTFSPRLGLNARLSPSQTVRAVVSRGTRAPDLFEQRADWSYTLENLSPTVLGATSGRLAIAAKAHQDLSSERITSRELGYMLTLQPQGLMLDVKVFDDRLTDLISDRLSITDFNPENNGSVRLTGMEVQSTWEMSPLWSGWLSYGYLLNRHASSSVERMQYARHSGGLGLSRALPGNWRASMAHYGASGNGMHENSYGRTDLTLMHAWAPAPWPITLSLTLSYLHNPIVSVYRHEGLYYTSTYDGHLSIRGQLRVTF